MSTLSVGTITLPAGTLGPDSSLPPIVSARDAHALQSLRNYPEDVREHLRYGRVTTPLPYARQDDYTHEMAPREFLAVTLENATLRAEFLPELGGRLRSLLHKPTGRELLSVNPVFKPVNFAIRGAWFSGGVEWNIGTIGHCPFTCSPLFAGVVPLPDGGEALRLYEYERIRGVVFQVDAYLPDEAKTLYLRMRIVNPHAEAIPMYWWSNAAVPETPRTRVLVPADSAVRYGYGKSGMNRVPIPMLEGRDVSYPTHLNRAMDFFYHIDDEAAPWEAAVDEGGRGLLLASTARLRGRKLFLWGQGVGGTNWQRFLSDGGARYIETQAGLARTQMEHIPMPARTEWSWLEAYGLLELEPAEAHGPWQKAVAAAAEAVEGLAPLDHLEQELERAAEWQDTPPRHSLLQGSGWGALAEHAARVTHTDSPARAGTPFPAGTLGPEQAPWRQLLDDGSFPEPDPGVPPRGTVTGEPWIHLLGQAAAGSESRNWFAWLHLGILRSAAGDDSGAVAAWQHSLDCQPSAWAHRNLAVLAAKLGSNETALTHYEAAVVMVPQCLQLLVEAGKLMVPAGRGDTWLEAVAAAPEDTRRRGRILLLSAEAALAADRLGDCEAILDQGFHVEDLREGERSLSDLWYALQARRLAQRAGCPVDDDLMERVRREMTVPEHLDFRMSV